MKSLLILSVLLCVALCVSSAAIGTLEATEENIQPFVATLEATEEKIQQFQPFEDQIAVIEEQHETGLYSFCPNGWRAFQGSCYRSINGMTTWRGAETACINLGATLVSLQNEWEVQFLQQEFLSVQGTIWIGGYYFQGRWGWMDGKRFDSGFTGTSPTANSCLTLAPYGYGWDNNHCNQKYGVVCERSSFC